MADQPSDHAPSDSHGEHEPIAACDGNGDACVRCSSLADRCIPWPCAHFNAPSEPSTDVREAVLGVLRSTLPGMAEEEYDLMVDGVLAVLPALPDRSYTSNQTADAGYGLPIYVLPDKPWPPGPAPLPRCRGCGRHPMSVPRHTEACDAR